MMKSKCCGVEPTNLIDMKCKECLDKTTFTEKFPDGDVVTHIPTDDFMNWLDSVDDSKDMETSKAERREYLEDLQERALHTIEVMFIDGVNCTDEVSDIRGLECIIEWAAIQLEQLD